MRGASVAASFGAVLFLVTDAVPGHAQARDAFSAQPAGTGTGSMSGRVTIDDSPARPLRRVSVSLREAAGVFTELAVTNDDGRFVFRRLPPGRYTLSAARPPYLPTTYGQKRVPRVGAAPTVTPIALTDGQALTELDMKLPRGASIGGRLWDVNGEPAQQVTVAVAYYERNPITGDRMLKPYRASATTDDRGVYRLFSLPPGDYVITAANYGRTMDLSLTTDEEVRRARELILRPDLAASTPPSSAPRRPTVGYVPVFFPGTIDATQATTVSLQAGEDRTGCDFRVQLVPSARIDGVVVGSDGKRVAGASVRAAPKAMSVSGEMGLVSSPSTTSDGEGVFVLTGLTTGTYFVQARIGAGATQLMGVSEVSVQTEDVTTRLILAPAGRITGRVVVDAAPGVAKPDVSRARISLMPAGASSLTGASTSPSATGEFTLIGAMPGQYRISVSVPGLAAGGVPWLVKSAVIDRRDVTDSGIEIGPNENMTDLVVTLTDRAAEISGTLTDAARRPSPEFFIIAFPAERALWTPSSRRIVQTRPASDGTFTIRGLPPGEYGVAAVTDVEQGEWFDAAFLGQLVGAAVKVTLGEGEKKVQDIRIRVIEVQVVDATTIVTAAPATPRAAVS